MGDKGIDFPDLSSSVKRECEDTLIQHEDEVLVGRSLSLLCNSGPSPRREPSRWRSSSGSLCSLSSDKNTTTRRRNTDLEGSVSGGSFLSNGGAEDCVEPVGLKVKKASSVRRRGESYAPGGLTYSILKFPLLLIILLIVAFDLVCYVLLRQLVKLRTLYLNYGTRERRKYLNLLKNAKTYEEWVKAGQGWDAFLHRLEWRDELESPFYDFNLIYKVTRKLKVIRTLGGGGAHVKSQYKKLKKLLLESGTKFNLAGIYHHRLHSHVYGATKTNISNFTEEVASSIRFVVNSTEISLEEKKAFLKQASKNYGRTALCLSGGAGFAYYHLGVIKALLKQNCLPKIISGTSAGAVMAAYVCTHTDDELSRMDADFITRHIRPFTEEVGPRLKRLFLEGAMVRAVDGLKRLLEIVESDITFLEAYHKTGRILNISVVSEENDKPPVLLNYQTTPNVVIASAMLASVAIPGIVSAIPLLAKEYWDHGVGQRDLNSPISCNSNFSHSSNSLPAESNINNNNRSQSNGRFSSLSMLFSYYYRELKAIQSGEGKSKNFVLFDLVKNFFKSAGPRGFFSSAGVDDYIQYVDQLNHSEAALKGHYHLVPFRGLGEFWRDGSFRIDIPTEQLQQLYNVQFSIVCQVNPVINMFIFDRHSYPVYQLHEPSSGFRGGFISSFLELALKLDMRRWMQIVRQMYLLPSIFRQDFSHIFLQPFHGSVTINPPFYPKDYWHIISNPVKHRIHHYLHVGSAMIYPRMTLIETRMRIEKEIDAGMDFIRSKERSK